MDLAAYEVDKDFFLNELDDFVPDRVFDAHCHLWREELLEGFTPPSDDFPEDVGYEDYLRLIDQIHPGRDVSALFISGGMTTRQKLGACNEWVASQFPKGRNCRGQFYVTPQDDPEWVRQEVRRLGMSGLKCYHRWADCTPTWQADIVDYLPEPLMKVANEEGWAITLHMVKSKAVADPGNLHWIHHYCERYPNMKLILAHAGRGFQPSHNLEGLPKLVGLENLYFDSSANCEPAAMEVIIRLFGHEKLLYGSDFYVSHMRGRSVGVGDSFVWLYGDNPVWDELHQQVKPVLIGLEHLRALKWACWSTDLSDKQVEDIFWYNAAELFGLD